MGKKKVIEADIPLDVYDAVNNRARVRAGIDALYAVVPDGVMIKKGDYNSTLKVLGEWESALVKSYEKRIQKKVS